MARIAIKKIVLLVHIEGKKHRIVYKNMSLYEAMELYGFGGDVLRFIDSPDYFYHPIDVKLPRGRELHLMHNIGMADYCFNKGRIGWNDYLDYMMQSRREYEMKQAA